MSKVLINETNLTNIANAIRNKSQTQTQYYPQDMAQAILDIPSGTGPILPELPITLPQTASFNPLEDNNKLEIILPHELDNVDLTVYIAKYGLDVNTQEYELNYSTDIGYDIQSGAQYKYINVNMYNMCNPSSKLKFMITAEGYAPKYGETVVTYQNYNYGVYYFNLFVNDCGTNHFDIEDIQVVPQEGESGEVINIIKVNENDFNYKIYATQGNYDFKIIKNNIQLYETEISLSNNSRNYNTFYMYDVPGFVIQDYMPMLDTTDGLYDVPAVLTSLKVYSSSDDTELIEEITLPICSKIDYMYIGEFDHCNMTIECYGAQPYESVLHSGDGLNGQFYVTPKYPYNCIIRVGVYLNNNILGDTNIVNNMGVVCEETDSQTEYVTSVLTYFDYNIERLRSFIFCNVPKSTPQLVIKTTSEDYELCNVNPFTDEAFSIADLHVYEKAPYITFNILLKDLDDNIIPYEDFVNTSDSLNQLYATNGWSIINYNDNLALSTTLTKYNKQNLIFNLWINDTLGLVAPVVLEYDLDSYEEDTTIELAYTIPVSSKYTPLFLKHYYYNMDLSSAYNEMYSNLVYEDGTTPVEKYTVWNNWYIAKVERQQQQIRVHQEPVTVNINNISFYVPAIDTYLNELNDKYYCSTYTMSAYIENTAEFSSCYYFYNTTGDWNLGNNYKVEYFINNELIYTDTDSISYTAQRTVNLNDVITIKVYKNLSGDYMNPQWSVNYWEESHTITNVYKEYTYDLYLDEIDEYFKDYPYYNSYTICYPNGRSRLGYLRMFVTDTEQMQEEYGTVTLNYSIFDPDFYLTFETVYGKQEQIGEGGGSLDIADQTLTKESLDEMFTNIINSIEIELNQTYTNTTTLYHNEQSASVIVTGSHSVMKEQKGYLQVNIQNDMTNYIVVHNYDVTEPIEVGCGTGWGGQSNTYFDQVDSNVVDTYLNNVVSSITYKDYTPEPQDDWVRRYVYTVDNDLQVDVLSSDNLQQIQLILTNTSTTQSCTLTPQEGPSINWQYETSTLQPMFATYWYTTYNDLSVESLQNEAGFKNLISTSWEELVVLPTQIIFNHLPDTTYYVAGDPLDLSGLSVNVGFNDGNSITVQNAISSQFSNGCELVGEITFNDMSNSVQCVVNSDRVTIHLMAKRIGSDEVYVDNSNTYHITVAAEPEEDWVLNHSYFVDNNLEVNVYSSDMEQKYRLDMNNTSTTQTCLLQPVEGSTVNWEYSADSLNPGEGTSWYTTFTDVTLADLEDGVKFKNFINVTWEDYVPQPGENEYNVSTLYDTNDSDNWNIMVTTFGDSNFPMFTSLDIEINSTLTDIYCNIDNIEGSGVEWPSLPTTLYPGNAIVLTVQNFQAEVLQTWNDLIQYISFTLIDDEPVQQPEAYNYNVPDDIYCYYNEQYDENNNEIGKDIATFNLSNATYIKDLSNNTGTLSITVECADNKSFNGFSMSIDINGQQISSDSMDILPNTQYIIPFDVGLNFDTIYTPGSTITPICSVLGELT